MRSLNENRNVEYPQTRTEFAAHRQMVPLYSIWKNQK